MNALDITSLRADTPGCAVSAFFNHSGASLPSNSTLAAITNHLERESRYGAMEAAAVAAEALSSVRTSAAALINAEPDDVAFTSSASAAIGLVFAALPPLRAGDRILVSRQEWGGNVSTYWAAAARAGATVEVIPAREDGSVDPGALANMIDSKVRLVSLTWVPANGGLINDAAAVGAVTRSAGVPLFVDAGQVLGQMPVDVKALQCDVLKGTCRKFLRGPRGTALLYVRREFARTLRPAFLDVDSGPWQDGAPRQRENARVFETVEMSAALLLGAGVALDQARAIGVDNIQARVMALAESLRRRLREIKGVKIHDLGRRCCGLVSFAIDAVSMPEVRRRLAAEGIVVGGNGVAYTPFDMTARNLKEIVRASVSYLNTDEEIDRLARAVERLARH